MRRRAAGTALHRPRDSYTTDVFVQTGDGPRAGPRWRRSTSADVAQSLRVPQAEKLVPIDRKVSMTTGVATRIKHTSHTQSCIRPLSNRRPRRSFVFGFASI